MPNMHRRTSSQISASQRPYSDEDFIIPGGDSQQSRTGSSRPGYSSLNFVDTPRPKRRRHWLWYAVPLIAGVVILFGVWGKEERDDNKKKGSRDDKAQNVPAGSHFDMVEGEKRLGSGDENNFVPTGYDLNGNPVYATSTNAAILSKPTSGTSSPSAKLSCPVVSLPSGFISGGSGASMTVRPDHPRLFADEARWDCIKENIPKDSYLKYWHETIMKNATRFASMPPTNYSIDGGWGGSGVLDVAREVQLRIKHWGYAWQMTQDPKWGDRTWTELQVAAGNNTAYYFGRPNNNWNTNHFLDIGEFTLAFGLAYDWLHSYWNEQQKDAIMWSMLKLGIGKGTAAWSKKSSPWWSEVNGNWNCVINGGFTVGALAIWERDPTGEAKKLLENSVKSATSNCVFGTLEDGTWSETANYWYFGNTGLSQMASALETATGSTQGLFDENPSANLSGLFHMYVSGNDGMFNYGDTGPNKYTATANSLIYYGRYFDIPAYTLYQRDRQDATEPLALLWYDPTVTGTWWKGLPLDHNFPGSGNAWVSMRSSWTDTDGLYVAMKAGKMAGHQAHGDIDAGDFVIDAMGTRWAGELNSGDYLAEGYFSGEEQDSQRWLYYRKRTEGQNALLLNGQNQNVDAAPPTAFDSSGDAQHDLSTEVSTKSTAFWWTDLTDAYNGTSIKRGIRLLNGRTQVLIQDEIRDATSPIQWRMHTNATVALSVDRKTATLKLNNQKMQVSLVGKDGQFGMAKPIRLPTDPPLPEGSPDQANPDVTVLTIDMKPGSHDLQVLFNPQWTGMSASDFVNPPSVPLDQWTLTSH